MGIDKLFILLTLMEISKMNFEYNLVRAKKFWNLKMNAVQYIDQITLLSDKIPQPKLALAMSNRLSFLKKIDLTLKIKMTKMNENSATKFYIVLT